MALVSPLLRLENNHCHIEESEYVLKKAHKYSELIILYEKKGLHRKGKGPVLQRLWRHPAPPHNNQTHLLQIYTFELIIRKWWIFPLRPASGSAHAAPLRHRSLCCAVFTGSKVLLVKWGGAAPDGGPAAAIGARVGSEQRSFLRLIPRPQGTPRSFCRLVPGLVLSSELSWFSPLRSGAPSSRLLPSSHTE